MPTPSSLSKSYVLKSITWDPFKVINNLLDVINQPHSPDLSPTLGLRWKADKFGFHLSLGWTFFLELTKWHPAFSGSENTVYFVFSDSGVPVKVTLWSHLVNPATLGWFPNSVKMIRLWSVAQPPPEARDTLCPIRLTWQPASTTKRTGGWVFRWSQSPAVKSSS